MANAMNPGVAATSASTTNRWTQLIIGIVCMVLIANLQYGWTLFVTPMAQKHSWDVAGIQFVQRLHRPRGGHAHRRLDCGPSRPPPGSEARGRIRRHPGRDRLDRELLRRDPLHALRRRGDLRHRWRAVYSVCVGNAVKWFADRRGLAVGLTAAGYGAGSALSVIPMRMMIGSSGYEATFFWFGLVQGGFVFLIARLLRDPCPEKPRRRSRRPRSCNRRAALRQWKC